MLSLPLSSYKHASQHAQKGLPLNDHKRENETKRPQSLERSLKSFRLFFILFSIDT